MGGGGAAAARFVLDLTAWGAGVLVLVDFELFVAAVVAERSDGALSSSSDESDERLETSETMSERSEDSFPSVAPGTVFLAVLFFAWVPEGPT